MNISHQSRSARAWGLGAGVLLFLAVFSPAAQSQLVIQRVEVRTDGLLELDFSGDPTSYYRLLSGSDVTRITEVVDLSLEPPLLAIPEGEPARFYRVQQIPRDASLDTDGDQIPDVYELLHPMLDPLDPTDAALDVDGSGRTALQVYLDSFAPPLLTSIVETSPAHGAVGVSVHRETIFRFSAPLAPGTTVGPNQFFAQAGTRRLLTRVELSPDRHQATLFYLEPIPSATRVTVVFDGTGIEDVNGLEVDADLDGEPGGRGIITFNTFGSVGLANTAVMGQVFASELGVDEHGQPLNMPLQGVIVTVDGAEETLRAVTDAEGRFTLSPAPAGRFFVHIDGRPAQGSQWPNGAYYPFIGKAWEAVPGKLDNIAGGTGIIYLPLVAAGSLQPVSSITDTTVTFPPATLAAFPELEGVEVTVPANALFSNDGTRGGRIGIAPVPSDRLPEPLPPGLEMPLVITIQTDGPENFAQPVPVRFPNLPDPVTGRRLPPGAKTALVSFDHDTGVWEVSGPMTVSADGLFVDSDPGTGVRQPGWHGWAPVASGSGGGYDRGRFGLVGISGTLSDNIFGSNSGASGEGEDLVEPEDQEPEEGDPTDPEEEPEVEEDDNGDIPARTSCEQTQLSFLGGIRLKQPFRGLGGLEQEYLAPSFHQIAPPGTITGILGNQVIEVDAGVDPSEQTQITWRVTPTGSRSLVGNTGRFFHFQLPLNHSMDERDYLVCLEVVEEREDGSKSIQYTRTRFKVLPNSGAHFYALYPPNDDLTALQSPFRERFIAFHNALKAGGADTYINAVRRAQKRAYLMHYSDRVANGDKAKGSRPAAPPLMPELVPPYDPNKPRVKANCDGSEECAGPLLINWMHLGLDGFIDRVASRAAAAALFSKFKIKSRAAFPTDRHGAGLAVDITIGWRGEKTFHLPDSTPEEPKTVTIAAVQCYAISCDNSVPPGPVPSQHCNPGLRALGAAYGVHKLNCDMPHWSVDGR